MSECKIKRALISVYDKTGVVEFARALVSEFGVEIISTGGTASLLKKEGIPVTLVEEVTGFPEMMDGRVKTLHPKIHAGILADRDNPEHMRQLQAQGIKPIDMVVVNLYPFEKTIADPNCTFEQAIEMIDIGGPCMLRAAAKNHKHVIVVLTQRQFGEILQRLRNPGYQEHHARRWDAQHTFACLSRYNKHIYRYFMSRFFADDGVSTADGWRDLTAEEREARLHPMLPPEVIIIPKPLRYGENPHVRAVLREVSHQTSAHPLASAEVSHATGNMSFNNYVDADAALGLCAEVSRGLCGTGFQPVSGSGVAPASSPSDLRVAPASSRWNPIEGDHSTRRNLPHLETTGRSYFVTFRTKDKTLTPQGKDEVLSACKHWHMKKMTLHAVVVMPDHVHMLLTPSETESGGSVALGEIVHSIKSFSANAVNLLEGWSGALWLDERWDRIMRSEKEFIETWEYIETNPDRAGLGTNYDWFWSSQSGFEETGPVHRLEAGTTQEETRHRQDAGATPDGTSHRLEAGATQAGATQAGATQAGATQTGATQSEATHACVFIKHTNACGVGLGTDLVEAYRQAYLGDPNAAMGGILACDFAVTAEFAEAVMATYARWGKAAGAGGFFVEVWVAPGFDDDAVKMIRIKKKWGERVRLLAVGDMSAPPDPDELDYKKISGGMLLQSRDLVGLNEDQWKVVTKRQPTDAEMADLRLAWLVCKHTKSNAITVCKDGMLIGNGAGQMSRVMSCRIATWLAKDNGHQAMLPGSVAASDAFFPFPDGPNILIDAGVKAIIQPGGSKRDDDTTAACDECGVAMIHTGTRHFKH